MDWEGAFSSFAASTKRLASLPSGLRFVAQKSEAYKKRQLGGENKGEKEAEALILPGSVKKLESKKI